MKTKRVPVWHLSLVTMGGRYSVLVFTSYNDAKLTADAYGVRWCPEITGPHYMLVPDVAR